jgi:hypothetical protein
MQKAASVVMDIRQARTLRLNQSMTAKLYIDVFGTAGDHNEVYINGTWIGHLVENRSEIAYRTTVLNVPAIFLYPGENKLTIKAGNIMGRELDKFLIRNIYLSVG